MPMKAPSPTGKVATMLAMPAAAGTSGRAPPGRPTAEHACRGHEARAGKKQPPHRAASLDATYSTKREISPLDHAMPHAPWCPLKFFCHFFFFDKLFFPLQLFFGRFGC